MKRDRPAYCYITGHSSANMVKLYAGAAMQRARAIEAQEGRK